MSKKELKALLEQRDAATYGNRELLIARIESGQYGKKKKSAPKSTLTSTQANKEQLARTTPEAEMFENRISLEPPLNDTRHRLLVAAEVAVGSDEKALFAELRRARGLGHMRALSMPDGWGRTPVEYAGSVHATRGMAWAVAPGVDVEQIEARTPSLKSLAYMQLSTADMLCARQLEVNSAVARARS